MWLEKWTMQGIMLGMMQPSTSTSNLVQTPSLWVGYVKVASKETPLQLCYRGHKCNKRLCANNTARNMGKHMLCNNVFKAIKIFPDHCESLVHISFTFGIAWSRRQCWWESFAMRLRCQEEDLRHSVLRAQERRHSRRQHEAEWYHSPNASERKTPALVISYRDEQPWDYDNPGALQSFAEWLKCQGLNVRLQFLRIMALFSEHSEAVKQLQRGHCSGIFEALLAAACTS